MGILKRHGMHRRVVLGVLGLTAAVMLVVGAPQRAASEIADKRDEPRRAQADAPASLAEGVRLSEKPEDKGPVSPRRGRRTMSESELDEALALLEQVKPELADRLASLRAEDERRASRLIQQRFPRVRYLLRLKEAEPAMYELRVDELRLTYQSRSLARQYAEKRQAGDDALAEAVRDELSVLLAEQFEVRQQIRQRELEQLEQRIAELRDRIEAQAIERDELIGQRLEELVDRAAATTDDAADDGTDADGADSPDDRADADE